MKAKLLFIFLALFSVVSLCQVANNPGDLNICDDSNDGDISNGFVQNIDLESLTTTVLAAQNPVNFTVTYHLSQADASSNLNPIASPFSNTVANSQIIFVRVTENSSSNFNMTTFNINVNPIPTANPVTNFVICDDNNDGSASNGFVQNIDLESLIQTILGDPSVQDEDDFTFTFHLNHSDAITSFNPISTPFSNNVPNQQTIYVRIENILTGCINTTSNFDVIINPAPTIVSSVELKICDVDTDGFSTFNLNEASPIISTNHTNQTITFYPTLTDANTNTNEITNPGSFINRTTATDTVWARVINSSGCFSISEVTLTVSTVNIPNTFNRTFIECDDFLDINGNDNSNNSNTDGVSSFDFSSVTNDISAFFPSNQQTEITYYKNQTDAVSETNSISDISNYRNIDSPGSQSIYVRIESVSNNGCLNIGPYITLNTNPVPTVNSVENIEECDDDLDGFVTFDLTLRDDAILNGQTNIEVTYHLSLSDAQTNNNPISSPYTNTVANSQTIYVLLTNTITGCINTTSFDLITKSCSTTDNDADNVPDDKEDVNRNGNLEDDDTDNDMTPNYQDDDDDDDGVLTKNEDYNNNGDPTDDDTNGNNIPDYLDNAVALNVEQFNDFRFSMYPNPIKEFLNIELNNSTIENLEVTVYNILGKKMLSKKITKSNTEIDVSTLNNGIYLFKISNTKKTVTRKLVIRK